MTIPNAMFLNTPVINSNAGALSEQVTIDFCLPGDVDVREAKRVMHEAALCSPYVYRKKPIEVIVEDRFDRGFYTCFEVKVYVMDVRFERLLVSDITERIKEEVTARGLLRGEGQSMERS